MMVHPAGLIPTTTPKSRTTVPTDHLTVIRCLTS